MRYETVVLAALLSATTAAGQEEPAEEADRARIDVGVVAEVRFARTGDVQSWLDGGLGKTRYGALDGREANVFAVPLAALVIDANYKETLTAHVQANVDAEPDAALDRGRTGLVEAYFGYRSDLSPRARLRVRGGLFFPPISLEHRGPAWTTVYTITPSAANSWIGEEVRAVGFEGSFGAVSRETELWLTGAVFGANDPMGSILMWRGWTVHDRQTMTGDRLPLPPVSSIGPDGLFPTQAPWVAPIRELDGHVGFYGGGNLRLAGRLQLEGLYLDNGGDRMSFDGKQYSWDTRFWNGSARLRLPGGFELLGQLMDGETAMGVMPDGTIVARGGFRAWYVLGSAMRGPVRLSVRYDKFSVEDRDVFVAQDDNNEDGEAWTAAVMIEAGSHVLFMAEWLRVESERPFRADRGLPVKAKEDLLQVGARVWF